jgi:hypothetical protein
MAQSFLLVRTRDQWTIIDEVLMFPTVLVDLVTQYLPSGFYHRWDNGNIPGFIGEHLRHHNIVQIPKISVSYGDFDFFLCASPSASTFFCYTKIELLEINFFRRDPHSSRHELARVDKFNRKKISERIQHSLNCHKSKRNVIDSAQKHKMLIDALIPHESKKDRRFRTFETNRDDLADRLKREMKSSVWISPFLRRYEERIQRLPPSLKSQIEVIQARYPPDMHWWISLGYRVRRGFKRTLLGLNPEQSLILKNLLILVSDPDAKEFIPVPR